MAKHTEQEMDKAGLTDEEREALLSAEDENETDEDLDDELDGEDEGEAEGDDGEGAEDDGDADDADDDSESDDADEPGDETSADAEDAESDESGDDGESDAKGESQQAPILNADMPADAEEKIKAIGEQKDALVEQFDNGDITAKEYQKQLDALNKQEREVEQTVFKAKLADEMRQTQAQNAWMSTVNSFLDENPSYRASPLMYRTLDTAVREIASQPENANLSGRQILEKAHEAIVEQFGLQKPAKEDQKPKAAKKPIVAPPTLGKVPAAAPTETENTRWSRLDRMAETDPERYEAEVAKLSDADREAYLSTT